MDQVCSECKQKAIYICICKDSYLCGDCREPHKKKYKGPHKIVLSDEQDLENIKLSFKYPKGKIPVQTPEKKKEDPPALLEEKKNLTEKISNDLTKLDEFKEKLISDVTSQASSLINSVISKYSGSINDFDEACKVKEKALTDAIDYLSSNSDISGNSLLCRLLDFPDLSTASLLEIKSTIKEESISIAPTLSLKVDFYKSEENSQILEYFSQNKDTILPQLKVLFDDIISERHLTMTTLKLPKFSLTREPLNQFSLILSCLSNLKVLQISENDLGLEGIKKISPILPKLQNLRKLAITKNNLKGPGGKAFGVYLKELKELLNLDLSGNKLGTEGMKYIGLALQSLVKLKSLKLMNNNLGNEAAASIQTCLPALKKLSVLRLGGNKLSEEQINLLQDIAPDKCEIKN